MGMKGINLQKELPTLREEVFSVNSLQEVVTTYISPFSLAALVAKMKYALKDVEEQFEVTRASVKENVLQVEKHRKHVEVLKGLQDKVVILRK